MSEKLTESDDHLVITRKFSAPRELVFDALTKHEHIKRWSCPTGMEVSFSRGELAVGGTYEFGMRRGDGPEIVLTGKFLEIDPPSRLVYTQRSRMPNGEESPDTTISITLSEVGGDTEMVFQHYGFASRQDRVNASMGWPSAMDKLSAVIEDLSRE